MFKMKVNPLTRRNSLKDVSSNINQAIKPVVGQIIDAGIDAAKGYVTTQVTNTLGDNAISSTVNELVTGVANQAREGADTFLKVGTPNKPSNNGNGGSKGKNTNGGSGVFDAYNPNRVDYNNVPNEVTLSTGLVPNLYGDLYQDADPQNVPLHMVGLRLGMPAAPNPSNLDAPLNTYFDKVVSFVIQNALQKAVSFGLTASAIEFNRLRFAFNAACDALQVYFFYDSVLQYTNNPVNRNEGMLHLRSQMDADTINNVYNLKRILEGTPIPPNLVSACFYLMQTFRASALPGSTLIKFCPVYMQDGNLIPGNLVTVMSTLATYRDTFGLLSRCCPNWVSSSLPAAGMNALHDEQFNTIWQNSPFEYSDYADPALAYSIKHPHNGSDSTDIFYTSSTNNLDGLAYALTTIYDDRVSLWRPSLLKPITFAYNTTPFVLFTNRVSFSIDGTTGLPAFIASSLVSESAQMAGLNFKFRRSASDSTDAYASVPFGSEIVLGVNQSSVTQSAFSGIEWLWSINSISGKSTKVGTSNRRYKKGA